MKTEKQYKYCEMSLKDLNTETREVAFYFNKFGDFDSDNDRFFPGSSKKTVSENFDRIKHLYNHWNTIGKPKSIQEDDYGTFMVSKLGRDRDSNDAYLKYQDGLITEHSFGLQGIPDKSVKNDRGGFDFYEFKMWEASSLDKWGAQSQTPVISVKSMDKSNIAEWVDRLQKLTKAIKGGYSDEQIQEFEMQMQKITEFLKTMSTTQPGQQATTEPEGLTKKSIYNQIIHNLNK